MQRFWFGFLIMCYLYTQQIGINLKDHYRMQNTYLEADSVDISQFHIVETKLLRIPACRLCS